MNSSPMKGMTPSPVERGIRAGFPLVRFMQAYLPLSVSRWVLKQSIARLYLACLRLFNPWTISPSSSGRALGWSPSNPLSADQRTADCEHPQNSKKKTYIDFEHYGYLELKRKGRLIQ